MGAERDDPQPLPTGTDAAETTNPQLRVARADNGFEVPLDHLRRSGERPLLWSVDERLRLVKWQMTDQVANRCREIVSLKLASGRHLEVPASLRIRQLDGWASTADARIGGRVAVLRRLSEPTQSKAMHESEVVLLAHMIGDGSCVKRQPIRYASIDEANLMAVTIAAAHFGVTPIRDEYATARVTTLRLPSPYRSTHGKRNPIAEWLDGLGIFGLRSYEKFVPAAVFALSREQIALFLRHLWATDGSVRWDAKTSQARVYYASTCRRLVDDVMQLLLRVGVQSKITPARKPGYRVCWNLTIDRAANQLAFLSRVGVHGERGIKAEEVIGQLAGRTRRPGTDTVPVEVWVHAKLFMKQRNWSDMQFALATNTRFDGPRMWSHAPGRTRLHRLANIFADSTLHDLAKNDVYWDRVVDSHSLGCREISDFSADTGHPVVVQGVLIQPARI